MTYPLIGNYGINAEDGESREPQVAGFIVRELTRMPSNFRSPGLARRYLAEHGILGIEGIDTRALVRRLRVRGAMNGVLSTTDLDDASLVAQGPAQPRHRRPRPGQRGRAGGAVRLGRGLHEPVRRARACRRGRPTHHVVALDYGMKWNILRCLVAGRLQGHGRARHRDGRRRPGATSPTASSSPTAPATRRRSATPSTPSATWSARSRSSASAWAISCSAWRCGAKTFKLKFGHRGANQPVRNERTGKVEITTQNHGFAVDPTTLPRRRRADAHQPERPHARRACATRRCPVFSVQYHPEAVRRPARQQLPVRGVPEADGVR